MMSRPGIQRALIAAVQVLSLAVWFSASAVVPALRESWQISATASVWLTASVQLGFVAGAITSTVLNLADRMRPHLLTAGSATLAAACTGIFALTVDGLAAAIPLRFLTGVFLAGVYPVGMKLTGSWAPPARRGLAFGVMIGALTLGSALPHLIGGLGDLPWRGVMGTAAGCALLGAVVAVALVREGPQFAPGTSPRPYPRYALAMFRQRAPRLVNLGYFGHMWELYALWTWLPSFLIAGTAARTGRDDASVSLLAFLAIGIAGVAGCLVGGWAADRFGRPRAAVTALVVSGACCLASPLFFTAPPGAVVLLGVVGRRGHRGLRCLLDSPERGRRQAVRRNRAHRTDGNRFRPDGRHHPARTCPGRRGRLALGVPAARPGSARRRAGDARVRPPAQPGLSRG
ncbi:hypothetical protein GCM10029963_03350 [Micromonospora andamanensis]